MVRNFLGPAAALVVGASCAPDLRSGSDRASPPFNNATAEGAGSHDSAIDGGRKGTASDASSGAPSANDASLTASGEAGEADTNMAEASVEASSQDGAASPHASADAGLCQRHRPYVAGDIDGDGFGDIALTGGFDPSTNGPWQSIPVAFSSGDGTFIVTNNGSLHDVFAAYATQQPTILGGNIMANAMGHGQELDLLLSGGAEPNGAPWGLPVAAVPSSLRGLRGTWLEFNYNPLVEFAGVAAQTGVTSLVGDFDGDTLSDVALVGWSDASILIAFSVGDGTFTVKQRGTLGLTDLDAGDVQFLSGDFDGDGRWDIAAVRPDSDAIVIAYSSAGAVFEVVPVSAPGLSARTSVPSRPALAPLVGDFNGDGRDDILFAGGDTGSALLLIAAAARGGFGVVDVPLGSFGAMAAQAPQLVSFDADGDGCSDIALVGGVDANGSLWTTLPVAFSNGDGTFHFTNAALPLTYAALPGVAAVDFQTFAAQDATAVSAGQVRRALP